ncbi:zinc dependent phospholipase C family protein [Mucilaginibacter boryungensis]|uniref:Zinc dependent phospholipase C family protein n=1 Tax=Mucilaginibacter boryungensis TaxID=768480 RepID=A0ABR9XIJ2_9SPHI|nr:zinc dependent phospholipase C family protein [Mucilaginibacter boryungensis]MBE9667203.1 zinc dependent phospholipase C family protein [Mucilaginibacter boryungensis]
MSISNKYKLIAVFLLLFLVSPASGFSILAHEAIIDAEWDKQIKPLLLKKYPGSTEEDLKKAHSYAYGGCMLPDMGYMPFGDPLFTNLLHYVRSGEFVSTLIAESQNLNDYAFSLGVLSHYMADKYGHSLATNKSVPIFNRKLRAKFGDVVTYADDHISHTRMEFAYDVIQTARSNYATTAYHDFIGFNMSQPVVERAFVIVYGQELKSVLPNFQSSVATFRWGVRDLFPAMINNAWKTERDTILKINPKATRKNYRYRMPRRMFNKEFGSDYKRPDFKARAVAFVIKVLPKIGPLKKFKFRYPGIACEKLFLKSMDTTLAYYTRALQADPQTVVFKNIDFDTGKPTAMAEYSLADMTYDQLLLKLQDDKFAHLTYPLQQNILTYYNNIDSVKLAQAPSGNGKKIYEALDALKALNLKNGTQFKPGPAINRRSAENK